MTTFKDTVLALRPDMADWTGQPCPYAEEKHNGQSVTIIIDEKLRVEAIGKKHWIDLWPKMARDTATKMLICALPAKTALMGEVYVPDGFSTDVPTALNGEMPWVFAPFAVPFYGGASWRSQDLLYVRAWLAGRGFAGTRLFPIDTREAMLERIAAERIEGYVLKQGHTTGWYKLKPVKTVDCIVTGWNPGVGQWDGYVGSFDVAVVVEERPDGELMVRDVANVGTGFKADERKALVGDECLSRVMEVEYQNVGAGGRLIFPRFLRWRDDKPACDCKERQLT